MRFLDTSFVIALLRRNERHHEAAAEIWHGNEHQLLVTHGVLGEIWTLMRRREHHGAAVAAIDGVTGSSKVIVVDTDADVHDAAWRWLRRRDDGVYSFVDAVSFELMRRRRLREALAFDDDFTRAGFVEVRAG